MNDTEFNKLWRRVAKDHAGKDFWINDPHNARARALLCEIRERMDRLTEPVEPSECTNGHDWRDGRLLPTSTATCEEYDEEWCARCGARLSEVETYSDDKPALTAPPPGDGALREAARLAFEAYNRLPIEQRFGTKLYAYMNQLERVLVLAPRKEGGG